jgi:hypothetical protein
MAPNPSDLEDPSQEVEGHDDVVTKNNVAEETPTMEQQVSRSINCWRYAARYSFGLLLSLLFVYSFVVQFNDTDGVGNWALFYLLHGFLAVLGLANLPKLRPIMAVMAGAMIVWSIVMVIITSSIQLAKTEAGGGGVEGGDNNNATDREEKAYELGGFKYSPPPTAENPDLSESPNPMS